MGTISKIEWTDATWNPIRTIDHATGKIGWHCEHVSEGCRNCYAESINRRFGTGLSFKPGLRDAVEIFLDEAMLLGPLHWKKPRRIFVNSMSDTFAEFIKDEWIDRMFAVMALTPQHTYQVLTKRPDRMRDYLGEGRPFAIARSCLDVLPLLPRIMKFDVWPVKSIAGDPDFPDDLTLHIWPLPNIWLGISAEDQATANERIPYLLATPAAVRFVSLEPLLGPIDLYDGVPDPRLGGHRATQIFIGDWWEPGDNPKGPSRHGLDWVIVGGESGPHVRPMHPDWVRSLRDQCAAAGVPYFFKQWGEWAPGECGDGPSTRTERVASFWAGSWNFGTQTPRESAEGHIDDEPDVYRLGKRAAARLLDGVEHNGMPQ